MVGGADGCWEGGAKGVQHLAKFRININVNKLIRIALALTLKVIRYPGYHTMQCCYS